MERELGIVQHTPGGSGGRPDDTAADTDSPIDVIYIGGTGRSGSTILEYHLAEAISAVAVGETVFLWDRGMKGDELCGCGKPFSQCPFWTSVAVGGAIDEHRHAFEMFWEGHWHRLKAIPRLMVSGRRVPTVDAAARAYGDLFEAIAKTAGRPVIVDSSKEAAFWLFLRYVPGIRVHTLHIVRDSRAVAHSWRRAVLKPELAHRRAEHMGIIPYWKSALKWLVVNLTFSTVRGHAHSGEFVTVRYEDFATEPEASLDRILSRLGPYVRETADDATSTPHAVQHSVSGNPVRFDRARLARITLDEEWRRAMPARHRRVVTVLSLPLLLGYRYL